MFTNLPHPLYQQPNGYRIAATKLLFWLLSLLLFLPQISTAAETTSGEYVRVRWLAPDTFATGATERIGFYFEVEPGWHVYWRNAGDSGAAPRFVVQANGATVSDIEYPTPSRLPIEHLTNLGYNGNVAYLLPVAVNDTAKQVNLSADLEWLVCKVECVPGGGQMTLTRPVGTTSNWQATELALRDQFLSQVPHANTDTKIKKPWTAASIKPINETQLQLDLTLNNASDNGAATLDIFPLNGDLLTATKPKVTPTENGLQYIFNRVPAAELPSDTDFVVSNGKHAWQLAQIPIAAVPTLSTPTPTSTSAPVLNNHTSQPLWLLILAAFAGGVVLNLMPCVLPVLSIKLFGLLETPAPKRIREAFMYSAGVLVTFAALGGLLLLLRFTGSAIGWGFQLQSPPVILALIVLFWLMALSFSGVFEFGNRIMNMASNQRGGAFITGVLAVFIATPCTGPFMGVALGAAAVLPAASAMAIFIGLGAGLAAPFALLSLSPALLKFLPKPGAWMETLRQLLAFPLYLTVVWLLWVLGRLLGDQGWLIGSLLILALAFVIWLAKSQRRVTRWAAGIVTVFAFVAAFVSVQNANPNTQNNNASSTWQAFDPTLIQQARAQGRAVFVDYTAAWCITCQVNKNLVLETEPVQTLFKQNNVLLMRADWTHYDPAITKSLEALGRNSLPVYVWYAADSKTEQLLPQILQEQTMRDLFK